MLPLRKPHRKHVANRDLPSSHRAFVFAEFVGKVRGSGLPNPSRLEASASIYQFVVMLLSLFEHHVVRIYMIFLHLLLAAWPRSNIWQHIFIWAFQFCMIVENISTVVRVENLKLPRLRDHFHVLCFEEIEKGFIYSDGEQHIYSHDDDLLDPVRALAVEPRGWGKNSAEMIIIML